MRRVLLLLLFNLIGLGHAQFLPKDTTGDDVKQCEDKGFIVVKEEVLKKTDRYGNIMWLKNTRDLSMLDDTGDIKNSSLQITSDGGYILAGYNRIINLSITSNISSYHNYLIKTDRNGNILWEKKYARGEANSVQITSDGGFIVAGYINFASAKSFYLFKTDRNGNILWEKKYARGVANSVQITSDGGFIVAGFSGEHYNNTSTIDLFKTDRNGNLLWAKNYGHGNANSVQITSDNGFIVAGRSGNYGEAESNLYLFKTDRNGNLLWENFFNAYTDIRKANRESLNSLQICSDGGYVMVGSKLIRTNADGEIYESDLIDQISSYVETKINIWQAKGEFEKTEDYKLRVSQETRNKMIDSIQREAILTFKNQHKNKLNIESIYLSKYDADNETFLIDIFPLPSILLAVPIAEAQNFKQNFTSNSFSNMDFIIKDRQFILSKIDISAGSKTYTYDITDNNYYAVTTFDYNFDEIEIDIEQSDLSNNVTTKNKTIRIGNSIVDSDIPENKKVANRYALVIGNQDYTSYQRTLSSEQNVDYAENDATIFKQYCLNTLGVKEQNMHFLLNATAGQMSQEIDLVSKIISKLGSDAELIVYYAGHGYPDELTKVPYLIPVDVSANNLNSAIKLSEVYEKLSSTNAGKISVFLDACFTGGGRNSGLIASRGVKIRPKKETLTGNMIVFSASSDSQSSLPYHKEAHGMFTFHLLKKLQESKGSVKMGALSDYLAINVSLQSLKENKKEQDPAVNTSKKVIDHWKNWKF